MGWPQNPDEYFSKPLTVDPVTNSTPQTPEPLAAGELRAEQLLKLGCKELGWEFTESQLNRPQHIWINGNGLQLLSALRTAIAADRAQRPRAEQPSGLSAEDLAYVLRGDNLHPLTAGSQPDAIAEHLLNHPATGPLLRRHPQAELVPVSERLPGPEDCDAEGRVWWLKERTNPDHDLLMPTWHLQRHGPAGTRFFRFTHWLPANALPLPSTTPVGEDQPNG